MIKATEGNLGIQLAVISAFLNAVAAFIGFISVISVSKAAQGEHKPEQRISELEKEVYRLKRELIREI